ncbi:glycosyltransferase [Paraburkholderia rhizosphaerae]|uniref:Glycosyltransferase involved in cell wall biosynthesis n=1 Tax=Paraburkholderia rhizosphaerae TaxID=480658 RepID=A0A4R8LMF7_9BURK|nr:glycosyltransferase [Paraburkholderia rhizosphaerae]TDY44479.1 glycosyltransferase involved in cell wall biosynthesis [Paraburkholderia rhizosphaerae]
MRQTAPRTSVLFHVVDFNDGGIESSLIQWLRILDRSRFEITLSVMFASPPFISRFRALIPQDVKVEILVDRPWLNHFQSRRYARKLSKLGRVGRDVFNTLAVRPYVRKRIASLAKHHDVIVDFDMSLRRWASQFNVAWLGVNHFSFDARLGNRPRKARRLAQQYARYDAVVALNQHMADEANAMFGDGLRRLVVLPNAIDIDAINASASAPDASTAPVAAPYIVSVARLDEIQKDHRTLLHAYAKMVSSNAVAEHLVIVGNGAFRQELEGVAAQLGIAQRVHFVGHQDNPHALIAHARALVLSSRYEGMPMVLLEALAHGKPIVATDCPTGPREILDDGRAGILVPIGEPDVMADALMRVVADAGLRDAMTANALARAQHYGIEQSNRRFAECVADILAARHAHRSVKAPA